MRRGSPSRPVDKSVVVKRGRAGNDSAEHSVNPGSTSAKAIRAVEAMKFRRNLTPENCPPLPSACFDNAQLGTSAGCNGCAEAGRERSASDSVATRNTAHRLPYRSPLRSILSIPTTGTCKSLHETATHCAAGSPACMVGRVFNLLIQEPQTIERDRSPEIEPPAITTSSARPFQSNGTTYMAS